MSGSREIKLFGHVFDPDGARVSLEFTPNGESDEVGLWLNCLVFTAGNTFGTEAYFEYEALRALERTYRASLSSSAKDYALHDTDHAFDLELKYDASARNYSCAIRLNFEWNLKRPMISFQVEQLRVELDVVQRFLARISEWII